MGKNLNHAPGRPGKIQAEALDALAPPCYQW
jgi:hypothetical protein